ncbi:hypothetical protein IBTHAUMO2_640001 [Nitrosopumilaceae archaeon]|nr:hypothetical protein IBTHAUMO2_640001 [Nitrosopumilaceae archaeon]
MSVDVVLPVTTKIIPPSARSVRACCRAEMGSGRYSYVQKFLN